MMLRLLELPADLDALVDVTTRSFQYPENKDWSVQTDEEEQFAEMCRNLKRLWPMVRLAQALSPSLRDILRGCVWEQDGRMVATSFTQRDGSSDLWMISNVGVLPEYRRQGIARKLVEATLELIRQHGGRRVILEVIDGNLPAYTLYQRLGFEHYSGSVDLQLKPEDLPAELPAEPALPAGYACLPLGPFEWQPRMELEKRISPENLLKYEPLEEARFRRPLMMRLLRPVFIAAEGTSEQDFVLRTVGEGSIVARYGYAASRRGKGVNQLRLVLDSAHALLGPYMVASALRSVLRLGAGLRVECSLPQWMEPALAACEAAGFQRRVEHCRMGLIL